MASSEELFVQLANGEYIWGLFHDIHPETYNRIYSLLLSTVKITLKEFHGKDFTAASETRRPIVEAGTLALLRIPEDAHRLFSLSHHACNRTDSADKIYEKVCDSFRPKNADRLTTRRSDETDQVVRARRFCFLCVALIWDYKRKNSSLWW